MTVEIPPIISVDDHVVEPPDLWQRYLPSRFVNRGPRVVRKSWKHDRVNFSHWPYSPADDGPLTDFWEFEDISVVISGAVACAGVAEDEKSSDPVSYADMRPGYYSLPERLADMDANHIERSLCFPTFPRFCGQTFYEAQDKELGLECIRAYNNWHVDEWAGGSGGRLIPLCLIPLWDPVEAAREIRRNAARGVRAVAFSESPAALKLPSIHDRDGFWDPVFSACDETGTVICMHIGSSSTFTTTSKDAPAAVAMALTNINSQKAMADWLLSGVLARFPQLRIAFSESQIGWMPFIFERCDDIFNKPRGMTQLSSHLTRPPSSYVSGRVFGCFFDDDFGLTVRHDIGIGQITFESDYPHQDSTWPNTRQYAEQAMSELSPEEIYQIVRGNAIEMLGLEETIAEYASLAAATCAARI
jgi:predicted TIM-barrel fold metal-dependent hydrolase